MFGEFSSSSLAWPRGRGHVRVWGTNYKPFSVWSMDGIWRWTDVMALSRCHHWPTCKPGKLSSSQSLWKQWMRKGIRTILNTLLFELTNKYTLGTTVKYNLSVFLLGTTSLLSNSAQGSGSSPITSLAINPRPLAFSHFHPHDCGGGGGDVCVGPLTSNASGQHSSNKISQTTMKSD